MPWDHCEHEAILDSDPCPTCGVTKDAWTLEWNVTRTLKVSRRPVVRLALLDAADREVAGEPYRVELPDGDPIEGALDDFGQASVACPEGVTSVTVVFPARPADAVRVDGQDAGAPLTCAAGARLRARLAPLFGARWSATRARLDEHVRLLVEAPGVPDGEAVTFVVLEHDADGQHDKVARLRAPAKAGRAEVGWRVVYVDDSDDEPTELDREAGFPLPEFVFVARQGEHEARCDERLLVTSDLELVVRDAAGRVVADADYVITCGERRRRGRTDSGGVLREAGVGAGARIALADGTPVVLTTAPAGR
jgi:hypothetical protein